MRLVNFLPCLRPFGLDHHIELVHLNGRVQHLSRPVKVADVMKANPQHIVGQPSCPSSDGNRTAVLPPDAELELGQIYFLLPTPAAQINSVDSAVPSPLRTTNLINSVNSAVPANARSTPQEVKNDGTLDIEDYDVVARLLISKECLAKFLSQKGDMERFIADEKRRNQLCKEGEEVPVEGGGPWVSSSLESEAAKDILD